MSTTFDAYMAESPLVQAEMDRLRRLHGVYEKALTLAVKDRDPDADGVVVRDRVEALMERATVEIHRAK